MNHELIQQMHSWIKTWRPSQTCLEVQRALGAEEQVVCDVV